MFGPGKSGTHLHERPKLTLHNNGTYSCSFFILQSTSTTINPFDTISSQGPVQMWSHPRALFCKYQGQLQLVSFFSFYVLSLFSSLSPFSSSWWAWIWGSQLQNCPPFNHTMFSVVPDHLDLSCGKWIMSYWMRIAIRMQKKQRRPQIRKTLLALF